MLFNSFEFILIFLPVTFLVYFTLLYTGQTVIAKVFLGVASLVFYSWWNINYLPLILISIAVNYTFGAILTKSYKKSNRKSILTFGIVFNVGLLGYFKYTDFFLSTINSLVEKNFPLLHLALPLAISFFTFQQISYLVDIYRREIEGYKIYDYVLIVTFFPHLIAGPIIYYKEIMMELHKENYRVNVKNIAIGIFIFGIGLFKKVVIADSFSIWANQGYSHAFDLNFFEAWIASLSYTFQLYFDFSGYCDMAMGAALLFNIRLPINFNSPYKALNIQDFWRRWHITLGRFLTKYIYFPLGGNKRGLIRTYVNLLIIFLVSGFWHGAGWTFIIWGSLHGIAMLIHRMWKNSGRSLPKPLAWMITFLFVHFAWVFFRADSIESAFAVIKSMVVFNDSIWSYRFHSEGNSLLEIGQLLTIPHGTAISVLLIFFVIFLSIWYVPNSNEQKEKFKPTISRTILFVLVATVAIYISFNSNSNSEFLYFNF
ncbi:MBOAT family protein [Neobacillus sp. MM2021_6]|uniref:MBOAT family O-acyltransferase n=1 Tax=Bacillaceae TaxID=186817 RepID=UPI00140835E8|nr:MBOAT family protein [Neobacillus sp. MM2021_6]NHC21241.1 MBOAT family protein [Bacillus sp. MM2020_4]